MSDKTVVKKNNPLFPVSSVGVNTLNSELYIVPPVVSTFNSIYICEPLERQNIFEILVISSIVVNFNSFNMHLT